MKTHWRKFINDTYLNESDFFHPETGEIITIVGTISEIKTQKVTNPSGKSDELPILHFNECKPLVLSAKINFKNIESALKSSFIEDWNGKKIELFYDPSVKFGSQRVGGVRVKPVAPKTNKQVLTEDHEHFKSIREAIASGTRNIEQIKRKFELTDSIITKLTETDAK
jgi:hypothetical protein